MGSSPRFRHGVAGTSNQRRNTVTFLPLAYLLRSSRFYRKAVFVPASGLIGLLGMTWLIERVFNVLLVSRFFTT